VASGRELAFFRKLDLAWNGHHNARRYPVWVTVPRSYQGPVIDLVSAIGLRNCLERVIGQGSATARASVIAPGSAIGQVGASDRIRVTD
jgi:hypothetical protein